MPPQHSPTPCSHRWQSAATCTSSAFATVPPTLRLTTEAFGETAAAMVFGWILAGHQLGAAAAAFMAGYLRTLQGDYVDAFVLAGSSGLIAAAIALLITYQKPPRKASIAPMSGRPATAA